MGINFLPALKLRRKTPFQWLGARGRFAPLVLRLSIDPSFCWGFFFGGGGGGFFQRVQGCSDCFNLVSHMQKTTHVGF